VVGASMDTQETPMWTFDKPLLMTVLCINLSFGKYPAQLPHTQAFHTQIERKEKTK